jgi:hypothetical protein
MRSRAGAVPSDDGDILGTDGGDADGDFIDPRAVGAEFRADPSGDGTGAGGNEPARKRRGRKPDAKASPRSAKANLSVEGIEKILFSVHTMCASFLHVPELALDENETKLLADAVANVAKHYAILPDPRMQAWFQLAMIAGPIYGMRFWAIRNKAQQRKAQPNGPIRSVPIVQPNIVMPTGAPPVQIIN